MRQSAEECHAESAWFPDWRQLRTTVGLSHTLLPVQPKGGPLDHTLQLDFGYEKACRWLGAL
jgi:hypothetical protein